MSVALSLASLSLVIVAGVVLARRMQNGYIDLLTPLLVLYGLHYVTRAAFIVWAPDWLTLNPRVAVRSDGDVVEALWITTAGVAALVVAYLVTTRLFGAAEKSVQTVDATATRLAGRLVVLGLAFRLIIRLAREELIGLPGWALTGLDTLGWAGLAGIFLYGFASARGETSVGRRAALRATLLAVVATLVVDGRFAASREAVLQPIIAGLLGRMMGAGRSLRRMAAIIIVIGLPIFLWMEAIKMYQTYELGEGAAYLESLSAIRDEFQLDWSDFVVRTIQGRFHGIDSLLVLRAVVPSFRGYEEGWVWTQILSSAFLARVLYEEKQVGWGTRFAIEFWGSRPAAEGSVSIGISHLGNFYIYGGPIGATVDMGVLGAALGLLAAWLRRRGDVLGLLMFVLVASTICQIDRDLEVALGGVLKLLGIFGVLVFAGSVASRRFGRPASVVASQASS